MKDTTIPPIEISLGPVELDAVAYQRLLTGQPITGEVIGGALDGYEFEVTSVVVDD